MGLGLFMVACGILNAVGQCCIAPPSYSLISQHHDNRTRSTAMGIFPCAVSAGVILSSVSAGALAGLGPGRWRWAFWIVGGLGLLWVVVLQIGLRDTRSRTHREGRPPCRPRLTIRPSARPSPRF